jgi:hypothetical protein
MVPVLRLAALFSFVTVGTGFVGGPARLKAQKGVVRNAAEGSGVEEAAATLWQRRRRALQELGLGFAAAAFTEGRAAWADGEETLASLAAVAVAAPEVLEDLSVAPAPAPVPAAPASGPSDEEAARIAKKLELQKRSAAAAVTGAVPNPGQLDPALAPRNDFNPDACANLRKRTLSQSMAVEKAREKEYKRTREDLCEVLGRGC